MKVVVLRVVDSPFFIILEAALCGAVELYRAIQRGVSDI